MAGQAQSEFVPNCAARKLCNRPLKERDPALHTIPPELEGRVPKGHLMPLGHPDFDESWAGQIDVVEKMDPETFWTEYWPRKPFLLKGWGKRSTAYVKWKDDSYLSRRFGDYKAKCEPKNEDRLTDYCNQQRLGQLIKCGPETIPYTETHTKLRKFLKRFRDDDFDKYVVTQMPDIMGDDVLVPNFHACGLRDPSDPGPPGGGRWMTQMYENNFWLSHNAGETFSTSVIHYDMNHQLMCLFDGTKEWIMWDLAEEASKIPLWSGLYDQATHSAKGSDDSPIDGERVDLLRWPAFKDAKWKNVTMEAGDCLYTPALLLHYVRSRKRNVAAMTMFQGEERYDPECGGRAPGEPKPLSAYDVVWSFPEENRTLVGYNVVKMGFPNWKSRIMKPLAAQARKAPGGALSRAAFAKKIGKLAENAGVEDAESRVAAVFAATDSNGDGSLQPEELFSSKQLRYLLKDIVVMEEGGRGMQEEDTEVDRYDLKGDVKTRQLEL